MMGAACCCFHVPDAQDNNSISPNCSCPKCFFSRLINKHTPSAIPPPPNEAPSPNSQAVLNTSRSRVQPIPEEKMIVNSISTQNQNYEASAKLLADRTNSGVPYNYPSLHREEECPTCLEEYTLENPKITAQCSHDFHLSCIYEWMERSPECPVCRKLMVFDD